MQKETPCGMQCGCWCDSLVYHLAGGCSVIKPWGRVKNICQPSCHVQVKGLDTNLSVWYGSYLIMKLVNLSWHLKTHLHTQIHHTNESI